MSTLSVQQLAADAQPSETVELEPGKWVWKYTDGTAAAGMGKLVTALSDEAIKRKGSFTIAIAGGSLVNSLGKLAGDGSVEWSKWHVFWVDERNVPLDHDDSNYKGANGAWLSKVSIPAAQVHVIKPGSVAAAAQDYEAQLASMPEQVMPKDAHGWPQFDLMLLGSGPDGHIASLFPGHKNLEETSAWVLAVADSPKPPPERITLTLPVINAARTKVFMVLGDGKADMVSSVLQSSADQPKLPAGMVQANGDSSPVIWVTDSGSAAKLNLPFTPASV